MFSALKMSLVEQHASKSDIRKLFVLMVCIECISCLPEFKEIILVASSIKDLG